MKNFTLLFLVIALSSVSMYGQVDFKNIEVRKTTEGIRKDISRDQDFGWFNQALEMTGLIRDVGKSARTIVIPFDGVLKRGKFAEYWQKKDKKAIESFVQNFLICEKLPPQKLFQKLKQSKSGIKLKTKGGQSIRFYRKDNGVVVETAGDRKDKSLVKIYDSADAVVYGIR